MFGCIHVPDFLVQAALLRQPKTPTAVFDGPESLLKVIACNQAARSAGAYVGMTKLQAEACGIALIRRVQEHEDAAQDELLDCAYHFSPDVEITEPGKARSSLISLDRNVYWEPGRLSPRSSSAR